MGAEDEKDIRVIFPKALKKAREAAGMTQPDLAGKLGMSITGVSKWEQGISLPSRRSMGRLVSVLPELKDVGLPYVGADQAESKAPKQTSGLQVNEPTDEYLVRALNENEVARDGMSAMLWRLAHQRTEFEQSVADALPPALQKNLVFGQFLARADYMSSRLVARVFPTFERGMVALESALWRFSCFRKLEKLDRPHVMISVEPALTGDDPESLARQDYYAKLAYEASLHSLYFAPVYSVEQVAEVIQQWENTGK